MDGRPGHTLQYLFNMTIIFTKVKCKRGTTYYHKHMPNNLNCKASVNYLKCIEQFVTGITHSKDPAKLSKMELI